MSTLMTWTRQPVRPARHDLRAERRRLSKVDALSSRLAELHAIAALLGEAAELVDQGWVQHGWFAVGTPTGEVVVTAYDLALLDLYPVTGACLVGAIVHAAGGPSTTGSQLVQRTLDLTWQALHGERGPALARCPSPPERTLRLLDLTHWNDARRRTRTEVVGLLEASRRLAEVQADTCRTERRALAAT